MRYLPPVVSVASRPCNPASYKELVSIQTFERFEISNSVWGYPVYHIVVQIVWTEVGQTRRFNEVRENGGRKKVRVGKGTSPNTALCEHLQ